MAKQPQGKEDSIARQRFYGLLILVVTALVLIVAFPTFLLLFFGLLPTAVATLVDRDPRKLAGRAVGGINILSVSPFLMQLWDNGHTTDAALNILRDPFAWFAMYAGAGVGWMLYMMMPVAIGMYLSSTGNYRLTRMEAQQRKLIEEWGDGVTVRADEARAHQEE